MHAVLYGTVPIHVIAHTRAWMIQRRPNAVLNMNVPKGFLLLGHQKRRGAVGIYYTSPLNHFYHNLINTKNY